MKSMLAKVTPKKPIKINPNTLSMNRKTELRDRFLTELMGVYLLCKMDIV
jgi:hypothetical protein